MLSYYVAGANNISIPRKTRKPITLISLLREKIVDILNIDVPCKKLQKTLFYLF